MIKNRLEIIRLEMSAAAGREITQTEFATLIKVGKAQYNRWARQDGQPNLERALRISRILKRPVEKVFYLAE